MLEANADSLAAHSAIFAWPEVVVWGLIRPRQPAGSRFVRVTHRAMNTWKCL